MSDPETNTSSTRQPPSPYRKEQDPAILEVFARADHPVLTTNEIADKLEHIGLKQTRRRLYDLVDDGLLATRKPARDRIWWLVEEVEEPITARYPLLSYVRNRGEVLITVLGALLGLVGAFAITLFLGLDANNLAVPLVSRQQILIGGLYSIAVGTAAVIAGISAIAVLGIGTRFATRFRE